MVGGLVVGLCALGLYVGIRCLRSASSGEPLLIVTLDCNYVSDPNSDYFPVTINYPSVGNGMWRTCTGLDRIEAEFGRVGCVARHAVIGGREYFGIRLFSSQIDLYQEPQTTVLEFYRRPIQKESLTIDMNLNTKITCELRMENFPAAVLHNSQAEEELTAPYVFAPGKYNLKAKLD
ncbi:MAG: hypothetical protein KAY65_02660 [Planctomycetes bacterium]|nr:hypothetical protein [Planctomycetota bacterium]